MIRSSVAFFVYNINDVSCFGWSCAPSKSYYQPIFSQSKSLIDFDASDSFQPEQQTTKRNSDNQSILSKTALSMTLEELEETLGGWGRARLVWDCYSAGVDPHFLFSSEIPSSSLTPQFCSEYSNKGILRTSILPRPRRTQPLGNATLSVLSRIHSCCGGTIEEGLASLVHISYSPDGTTKLLLRMMDGLEVETVLIPFWSSHENHLRNRITGTGDTDIHSGMSNTGRTTVCLSSQVGCRQGCTFCATGRMGRLRSLTADEILVQLFYAKKIVRLGREGVLPTALPLITNIVFMGMGEPADNALSVRAAIDIMTKRELFQLSSSRVTVSTVAPNPEAFMEFVDSNCILAWSVHAVRDELRRRLVPTTKFSMEELRKGFIDALKKRKLRTCMVEVVLIDGINDSIQEATELANFITYITKEVPGSKIICNLIPYNHISVSHETREDLIASYRKPPIERITAFQKRMQELRVYAHVRQTRGDEELAACGQLATSKKRKDVLR